jgi:hypothetical protein
MLADAATQRFWRLPLTLIETAETRQKIAVVIGQPID